MAGIVKTAIIMFLLLDFMLVPPQQWSILRKMRRQSLPPQNRP
ncbi:hypothetical protein [Candidatus Allofournierella excrementavium]